MKIEFFFNSMSIKKANIITIVVIFLFSMLFVGLLVDPSEAIKKFLHFIGSRALIGYYLEFDVAMINQYMQPMLGITLPNKMIEVSEIYFEQTIALIPEGNIDLRFDTILKNCKVPDMGAHNAVNDAIMTAMIYLKLTKEKN